MYKRSRRILFTLREEQYPPPAACWRLGRSKICGSTFLPVVLREVLRVDPDLEQTLVGLKVGLWR